MYKNDLTKWIVEEFLIDELQELLDGIDENTPISDYPLGIVGTIFESHSATGSYTCNTREATKWVLRYFENIREFVQDLALYHREDLPSVWDSPEQFQLMIMYHMSMQLVCESATLNHSYTFMNDVLKDLIEELEELKD